MSSKSTSTSTTSNTAINTNDESSTPLQLQPVQLEAIADALQEQLIKEGRVHDHEHKSRTITKAFCGSDAVSCLLGLLKDQLSSSEVTHAQALQVGRDIQKQFHFFSHSKTTSSKSYDFLDSDSDLYQFKNNLPMQVHTVKKKYPSMWDKVRVLEENIQLSSHKGIVKTHHDCFIAKEAVTVLMGLKLVRSTGEAVHLIRKMNEKVHCCRLVDHPGNDGSNFRDDNSLYRFFAPEDRVPEPMKKGSPHSKDKSSKKSSMRRIRSTDSLASTRSSASTSASIRSSPSCTKDAKYSKKQARSLRRQLDIYRNDRYENQRSKSMYRSPVACSTA